MRIAVIGAGRMGHSIAASFALGGHSVVLTDTNADVIRSAPRRIENALATLCDEGVIRAEDATGAQRAISLSGRIEESCEGADLIQECVPEVLDLKQSLFRSIEDWVGQDCIVATNTSSFRLSDVAAAMTRAGRLIGIHWVSPAHVIPLVEVVVQDATDTDVVTRTLALLEDLGKVPVKVRDEPGFLVNRLQHALRNAALSIAEEGIASFEDIDRVVKYALAPRQFAFGVLRLADLVVSGQTSLSVGRYLYESTGDARYRPTETMERLVAQGRTGLQAGHGYFDYPGVDADQVQSAAERTFCAVYAAQRELEPRFVLGASE